MEKMLHERLREFAKQHERDGLNSFDVGDEPVRVLIRGDEASALADAIEREYLPRPRDVNGVPLREGMVLRGREVGRLTVCEDGYWEAHAVGGADTIAGGFDFEYDGDAAVGDTWTDVLADLREFTAQMNSTVDAGDLDAFIGRIKHLAGDGNE